MSYTPNMKSFTHHALPFILPLLIILASSSAELPRFDQAAKPDKSLSFLVVGDWGRKGAKNQTEVARQMGIVGERLKIDFVISTGDNFYDKGLTGVNDPAFSESFTKIYTAPSLQKQWYSVLGNHDHKGDVEAQVGTVLRAKDKRWLCLRAFLVNAGIAEFYFLDTTPFVKKNKNFPVSEEKDYVWSGIEPRNQQIPDQFKELESALKKSKAKWKIVVGHHAIKSAGNHGNTPELNQQLLPILQKNGVDFYMNGHDHCLEHISNSGIQFFTSGGGSAAWEGPKKKWSPAEEMKFFYEGQGFMSVQITPTEARVVFFDVFGKSIHNWSTSKRLSSSSSSV